MARGQDQAAARLAVRRRLAERQMTWGDLARQANVDSGTLTAFMNGDRHPYPKTLARISSALGWPPGYLVEVAAGGPDGSADPDALLVLRSDLPHETKERLLRLLGEADT